MSEWVLGPAEENPLHYTWCGLDDIYLVSGFERINGPDGEEIVIQDMDGLHRAIGKQLAMHKKALNGKEIRFLRHQMDLTQKELGDLLAITDQSVARWEKNERDIPGSSEMLLRAIYMGHLNSNLNVKEFAKRIRELESVESDELKFVETEQGWMPSAA